MGRLQRVAVWAQDTQVLEAIVEAVAIDMIELDGDAAIRRALRPAASLAPRLLEPGADQPKLELVRVRPAASDEHLIERHGPSRVVDHSLVPGLPEEMTRVEVRFVDASTEMFIVGTCRHEPKRAEDLRQRVRGCHSIAKVVVGPPPEVRSRALLAEVRGVQTQRARAFRKALARSTNPEA
jgi:hypothetical protein